MSKNADEIRRLLWDLRRENRAHRKQTSTRREFAQLEETTAWLRTYFEKNGIRLTKDLFTGDQEELKCVADFFDIDFDAVWNMPIEDAFVLREAFWNKAPEDRHPPAGVNLLESDALESAIRRGTLRELFQNLGRAPEG